MVPTVGAPVGRGLPHGWGQPLRADSQVRKSATWAA